MHLNQQFKSFAQFEAFSLQWQKDTFQNYVVDKSDKFGIGDPARETLSYKNATYICIHGKQRKQKSTGARPQQRTQKLKCPVFFSIRGSKRAGTLTVSAEPNISEHNHATGKEIWDHEAANRRLSKDDLLVVEDLWLNYVVKKK